MLLYLCSAERKAIVSYRIWVRFFNWLDNSPLKMRWHDSVAEHSASPSRGLNKVVDGFSFTAFFYGYEQEFEHKVDTPQGVHEHRLGQGSCQGGGSCRVH